MGLADRKSEVDVKKQKRAVKGEKANAPEKKDSSQGVIKEFKGNQKGDEVRFNFWDFPSLILQNSVVKWLLQAPRSRTASGIANPKAKENSATKDPEERTEKLDESDSAKKSRKSGSEHGMVGRKQSVEQLSKHSKQSQDKSKGSAKKSIEASPGGSHKNIPKIELEPSPESKKTKGGSRKAVDSDDGKHSEAKVSEAESAPKPKEGAPPNLKEGAAAPKSKEGTPKANSDKKSAKDTGKGAEPVPIFGQGS